MTNKNGPLYDLQQDIMGSWVLLIQSKKDLVFLRIDLGQDKHEAEKKLAIIKAALASTQEKNT